MPKLLISGKFFKCFKLANQWAPDAIKAAKEGLNYGDEELPLYCQSCASEFVLKMGGTSEHAAMVAGFAGGIGLCGGACGALGAAIWMTTLNRVKENAKVAFDNPEGQKILQKFMETTDYKFECKNISRKMFNSLEEHTDYIDKGGCSKLISALAEQG